MRSAFALRIISGRIILNFGVQKHLRAFLNHFFTRKDQTGNDFFTGKFPVFLYGPFCENAFGAARRPRQT